MPGLAGYHDVHSYPEAEQLPGCVIFRFDAPLIFANARTFREQIRALARTEPPPTWIIVAAEPITDIDTTAADMLEDLDEALNERGISLVFAEMKDPVRAKDRALRADQHDRSRPLLPHPRRRHRRISRPVRRRMGPFAPEASRLIPEQRAGPGRRHPNQVVQT